MSRSSLTSRRMAPLVKRDGSRCVYCGWSGGDYGQWLVADHVVPVCQGGTDDVDNLVLACNSCNSRKGGRTPEQWVDAVHGDALVEDFVREMYATDDTRLHYILENPWRLMKIVKELDY